MTDLAPKSSLVLAGVRLLYGSALLLAPGWLLGDLPDAHIDRRALVFSRVLGARHIIQAAVFDGRGARGWIVAGAAVDATRAGSMALLAPLDPRRRTLVSANALGATAFALVGLHQARRS
jgi:hypothetical protein